MVVTELSIVWGSENIPVTHNIYGPKIVLEPQTIGPELQRESSNKCHLFSVARVISATVCSYTSYTDYWRKYVLSGQYKNLPKFLIEVIWYMKKRPPFTTVTDCDATVSQCTVQQRFSLGQYDFTCRIVQYSKPFREIKKQSVCQTL